MGRDNDRRPDLVVCFIISVPRSGPTWLLSPRLPGPGRKFPRSCASISWPRWIVLSLPAKSVPRLSTGCTHTGRCYSACLVSASPRPCSSPPDLPSSTNRKGCAGSKKGKWTRVKSRRGAVPRSSPFPLPAHQTGRADFPHPAFRPASWQAHDMTPVFGTCGVAAHRGVPNTASADMPAAARRQLVTPDEEVAHVVIQMRLDHPVRGVVRARTEVATPSPQQTVQRVAHFLPCPHVPRHQDRPHLVLQTLHALLRRAGPDEPASGLAGGIPHPLLANCADAIIGSTMKDRTQAHGAISSGH